MKAADTPVEAAFDSTTGHYTDWCFASHPNFPAWCQKMLAAGREIRTMTIQNMCIWLDENPLNPNPHIPKNGNGIPKIKMGCIDDDATH